MRQSWIGLAFPPCSIKLSVTWIPGSCLDVSVLFSSSLDIVSTKLRRHSPRHWHAHVVAHVQFCGPTDCCAVHSCSLCLVLNPYSEHTSTVCMDGDSFFCLGVLMMHAVIFQSLLGMCCLYVYKNCCSSSELQCRLQVLARS